MIGEIADRIDFLVGYPAALPQVEQIVLHLQQLRSRHRQISFELARAVAAEAFGDQVRRRASGFSKGIAEFEVSCDPRCFTNCNHALAHLHRKLPRVEIFESVDSHADGMCMTRAGWRSAAALPHWRTAALQHCRTAAL